MEIVYTSKKQNIVYAVAGGSNPKLLLNKVELADNQIFSCMNKEETKTFKKNRNQATDYHYYNLLFICFAENTPLLLYSTEGGTCETCLEIFLRYGNGKRPNIDDLYDIRTSMDDYDGNINGVVKKLGKLMDEIFPIGLYEFKYTYALLADMDGNFSWSKYQSHNYLPHATPLFPFCISYNGTQVYYLLASQPISYYNQERVEYYRSKIREGRRFGCIALTLPSTSNYGVILDGHHRIIASMLEEILPDCLMINKINLGKSNIEEKDGKVFIDLFKSPGGRRIVKDISRFPSDIIDALKNPIKNEKKLDEEKTELYQYYRGHAVGDKSNFPKQYQEASKKLVSLTLNRSIGD